MFEVLEICYIYFFNESMIVLKEKWIFLEMVKMIIIVYLKKLDEIKEKSDNFD